MKLTALRIHNVRRFANRGIAVENISDGVNVLSAANEYGKSTLFDSLHSLFFQPHSSSAKSVRSLQPYSGGNPLVEVDIETSQGRFRLTKQFLGRKSALVFDLDTSRLIKQSDEAEQFIGDLVKGGMAGPAGLLWVRQGNTGLEKRPGTEEESERQAREDVLSSVQGEIEAVTGGRRMLEAIGACQEELFKLLTATGRPKAGGPFALAIEERDRLADRVQLLAEDVHNLHQALDQRRKVKVNLSELQEPEAVAERQQKLEETKAAFEAAKGHLEKLKNAQDSAALLRGRKEDAAEKLEGYRSAQERWAELKAAQEKLSSELTEALDRQREARKRIETVTEKVQECEESEREARELFNRLDRALRAQEEARRKDALSKTLAEAEIARKSVEESQALLRMLIVPEKSLRELEALENTLIGLRAAATASAPSAILEYAADKEGAVMMDGRPMAGGKSYPIEKTHVLNIPEIGSLTLRAGLGDDASRELTKTEEDRTSVLAQIDVASLAEARQRDADAKSKRHEMHRVRDRLDTLAPEGIEKLREELARLGTHNVDDLELKGDPEEARRVMDEAGRRAEQARNAEREAHPVGEKTNEVVFAVQARFENVRGELTSVAMTLGPEEERDGREARLADKYERADAEFMTAQQQVDTLAESEIDLAGAEAAFQRAHSVVTSAQDRTNALERELADLNGQIRTRSEDAIEEAWQETKDKLDLAEKRVDHLTREVVVLQRLHEALDAARIEAREQYFEPVMRELKPLMGLLFDDASIVFDDNTLLPQTVERNGEIEEVERLSGGMREQLSVLTRLAFARLLAREGEAAPVILDDALVYSDDDRIEKMFDALHRQSQKLQIIVFSCRQRAFSKLGGNVLLLNSWQPEK